MDIQRFFERYKETDKLEVECFVVNNYQKIGLALLNGLENVFKRIEYIQLGLNIDQATQLLKHLQGNNYKCYYQQEYKSSCSMVLIGEERIIYLDDI